MLSSQYLSTYPPNTETWMWPFLRSSLERNSISSIIVCRPSLWGELSPNCQQEKLSKCPREATPDSVCLITTIWQVLAACDPMIVTLGFSLISLVAWRLWVRKRTPSLFSGVWGVLVKSRLLSRSWIVNRHLLHQVQTKWKYLLQDICRKILPTSLESLWLFSLPFGSSHCDPSDECLEGILENLSPKNNIWN